MKLIYLFFLLQAGLSSLYAQTGSASAGAVNNAFSDFRERLCATVQDSILLPADSIQSYRVLFSTDIHFEARLDVLSKTYPGNNLVQEDLRMHIQGLGIPDPRYRFYRSVPNTSLCGNSENPHTALRSKSIESIPFDTIYVEGTAVTTQPRPLQPDAYRPERPSLVQSYAGGRYLVLDYILFFSYIGSETDRGTLKSFFLERVE
ncbi:MAG: hypothetical protein IBJ09_05820 [Bacteroidia bacterium]|nr:hypothetical protein [Bacteroidia bacterium]